MFFFVSPRFIHRLALTRSAPGGAVSVGEGVVYSGLLKLYMVDCCPPGKSLSGADSPPVNSELTHQKEEDRKTLVCDKRDKPITHVLCGDLYLS